MLNYTQYRAAYVDLSSVSKQCGKLVIQDSPIFDATCVRMLRDLTNMIDANNACRN